MPVFLPLIIYQYLLLAYLYIHVFVFYKKIVHAFQVIFFCLLKCYAFFWMLHSLLVMLFILVCFTSLILYWVIYCFVKDFLFEYQVFGKEFSYTKIAFSSSTSKIKSLNCSLTFYTYNMHFPNFIIELKRTLV